MEAYLHDIRKEEFDLLFHRLKLDTTQATVLEIGSGTGYQLEMLSTIFKDAAGIDVESSTYSGFKTDRVKMYDGFTIPFPDKSFDYIFSSNVLEHIPHLELIGKEFKRVLKPGGKCIHIVPTTSWKFWSLLTHYPAFVPRQLMKSVGVASGDSAAVPQRKKKTIDRIFNAIFPERHGERGNKFTEFFYFRPAWWLKHFRSNGWTIVNHFPVGLFYTGNLLFGHKLGMPARRRLAGFMGSSCYAFVVRPGD